MQYFCSVSTGEDKLPVLHRYVCACTDSLFSPCTQHGGRLISRSNISVGNGKMAEMHAEATPFFSLRARQRKHWHSWQGKCDIFCTMIPLYLQIDALSEIDRRRRNECTDTKTCHQDFVGSRLWSIVTSLLFKAQRTSCLCYSNLEGLKKMCVYLLVWKNHPF